MMCGGLWGLLRFRLGSQASQHAKPLCLAGKCFSMWPWHHLVGGALVVDFRNLYVLLRREYHHAMMEQKN